MAGQGLRIVAAGLPLGVRQGFGADVVKVQVLEGRPRHETTLGAVPATYAVRLSFPGTEKPQRAHAPTQFATPDQNRLQHRRQLEGLAHPHLTLADHERLVRDVGKPEVQDVTAAHSGEIREIQDTAPLFVRRSFDHHELGGRNIALAPLLGVPAHAATGILCTPTPPHGVGENGLQERDVAIGAHPGRLVSR